MVLQGWKYPPACAEGGSSATPKTYKVFSSDSKRHYAFRDLIGFLPLLPGVC